MRKHINHWEKRLNMAKRWKTMINPWAWEYLQKKTIFMLIALDVTSAVGSTIQNVPLTF